MLSAVIRPIESVTIQVSGDSLADIHAKLAAQAPAGFDLASAPVSMAAGSSDLTATATFHRTDGTREIEAADMTALEAQVPDGWRMLSVRSA